jgi:hypothetical protein
MLQGGLNMKSLTESKFQGWRALAIEEDRTEHLIFLGRSSTQVRAGYVSAYWEVLDADERAQVRQIALQRWQGAPDEGKWVLQTTLSLPTAPKAGERVLAASA